MCQSQGHTVDIFFSIYLRFYSLLLAPVDRIECHQNTTSRDANVSSTLSPWRRQTLPQQDPGQLVFVKSLAALVVCSVYGGYPPPSVSLCLGPVDITGLFDEPTRLVQVTGVQGLRQALYQTHVSTDRLLLGCLHRQLVDPRETHVSTDSLVLGYSQRQLEFRCEATVPGLPAVSLRLTTLLQCKLTGTQFYTHFSSSNL